MAAKVTVKDIDHGYRSLLVRLRQSGAYLTVGLHEAEGAAGKETKTGGGGTDLMTVGEAHEFGLGVPRRSFIADWADETEDKHKAQFVKMAKAIVKGTVSGWDQGLARLGALYVGEVQRRISKNVLGQAPYEPLKQATIDRKHSSVALVDTGQLKSAIRFYVNGNAGETAPETETVTVHLVRNPGGEWVPSVPSGEE